MWSVDLGAPILQSAAYDSVNGNIIVGTEDGVMHARAASNGAADWTFGPVKTHSFMHFCPVVSDGKVLFRGQITQADDGYADRYIHDAPMTNDYWSTGGATDSRRHPRLVGRGPPLPSEFTDSQDYVQANIAANNWLQDLWVLNAATGAEVAIYPHWPGTGSLGIGGPLCPPAIDAAGKVIIHTVAGGGNFGLLNLSTGYVEDILFTPMGSPNIAFQGNVDEWRGVSAVGDLIFVWHKEEGNVSYTGVVDMATRTWYDRPAPWLGGKTGYTFEKFGAPVSFANGRFYHVVRNTINCFHWVAP